MCTTHDRLTAFWAKRWMTSLTQLIVFINRVPVWQYTFKYWYRTITEQRQNFANSDIDCYTNEDAEIILIGISCQLANFVDSWCPFRCSFGCILLLHQLVFENNEPFDNTTPIYLINMRCFTCDLRPLWVEFVMLWMWCGSIAFVQYLRLRFTPAAGGGARKSFFCLEYCIRSNVIFT